MSGRRRGTVHFGPSFLIQGFAMRPPHTVLDDLRPATPCRTAWASMCGDDHTRRCPRCHLRVHNIVGLERDEAEELIFAREGRHCFELRERIDGTILTRDCPIARRWRRMRI